MGTFPLVEILSAGLRSDPRMPVNSQVAEIFRNLKPTPFGAARLEPLTDFGFPVNHPYPNALSGKRASWLFDDTQVFQMDEGARTYGNPQEEHITNGSFTGSSAGWTISDASITYGTNNIVFTATPISEDIQQLVADMALPVLAGRRYRVTYTVTVSGGSIRPVLGNVTGTTRTSSGTYTEEFDITGAGPIGFVVLSEFTGTLDNVSVKLLSERVYDIAEAGEPGADVVSNGAFTSNLTGWSGSGWTHGSARANHASGAGTTALTQACLTKGTLYRIVFTVTRTGGTLYVQAGTKTSSAITASGTYEFDLLCVGNTSLGFLPSNDFDGSVDTVSAKPISELTLPSGGGVWHFADFGDTWFAAKDGVCVARLPYYSDFRLVAILESTHGMNIPVVAAYGNTLLLAGLESDIFDPTQTSTEALRWQDAWRHWIEASESTVTHTDLAMNSTTVLVSTPSGGDYDVPFIQEMALLGFPSRSSASADLIDNYNDVITKKELTFIPLPQQDETVALKALGRGFAAYCADGCVYCEPTEAGWAVQQVKDVGLAQRGTLLGNERFHKFIDKTGVGWLLPANLQLVRLGHKEWFQPMLSGTVVGCWDDQEGDGYFCTDTVGYVSTPSNEGRGLGETTKLPTFIVRDEDDLLSVFTDLGDSTFEVLSGPIDMAIPEQKIIDKWDAALFDATNVIGQVQFRNDTLGGSWLLGQERSANRSVLFHPNVVGRNFKIRLEGTLGTDTKLDRIGVYFKLTEKRSNVETVRATTPGYQG